MHRLIKIRVIRDHERLEERMRRWRDQVFEFGEMPVYFRPPADLFETAQGLVLRMEMAGLHREDFSLVLEGQELVIRGRRRFTLPVGSIRFLCQELGYGTFERRFSLPNPVDPQGVQAHYEDGILEVILPRSVPLIRRIPVNEE